MNSKDTALSNKISALEEKVDRLTRQIPIDCPSGWINKDGIGCFYFGTTKKSWQDARNHCKSKNVRADLAEIHNAETNTFLHNIIKQKAFNYWWIGASDKAEVTLIFSVFLAKIIVFNWNYFFRNNFP